MEEYIGKFKVTMHGIDLMKAFEAVEDLFEKADGLVLWYSAMFFAVLFQIASVTELSDNEDIITGTERVSESDDILVFDLLEDFDLGFDELLEFGDLLHLFFAEGLDGKNGVSFGVDGFVDSSKRSTSKFREEIVLFDFFAFEQLPIVSHEFDKNIGCVICEILFKC
jgi:hypothetical protein